MILSVITIAIVALIAYLWAGQGAFSAFLHMVCTLVAGAVAFALWETITNSLLIGLSPSLAWALGLVAPFALTLLALRMLVDRLLPANIDLDDATNFVGGALFGAVAGVISAGVLLISLSFLRIPADFMDYQPVKTDETSGGIVRGPGLLFPADKLTAGLYERLSLASFSTDTPLALRRPDAQEMGTGMRMTYDGYATTVMSADDLKVIGRYSVVGKTPDELFSDSFAVKPTGEPLPRQKVTGVDGQPPEPGSTIEGFVLQFEAGSKEKNGQIMVGPGQLRLVVEKDGDAWGVHPIAVISQVGGASRDFSRFRFDAPEVFIASVGGASNATMAFEFAVPPGAKPTDLFVKGVRIPITPASPARIAGSPETGLTPAARDAAIRSLALVGKSGAGAQFDTSGAATVAGRVGTQAPPSNSAVRQTPNLPSAFNKSEATGLEISAGGADGKTNVIMRGKQTFRRDQFNTKAPQALRVGMFNTTPDTAILQVDVSLDSKLSLLGRSVQSAESVAPPMLIDSIGQTYQAVGWIFEEPNQIDVRFTPDEPIRGLAEIPTLSRTKSGQKLTLLFVVSKKVSIEKFTLGSNVVAQFDPAYSVN